MYAGNASRSARASFAYTGGRRSLKRSRKKEEIRCGCRAPKGRVWNKPHALRFGPLPSTQCAPCMWGCATCHGEGAQCDSCKDGFFFDQQGQACFPCPTGVYVFVCVCECVGQCVFVCVYECVGQCVCVCVPAAQRSTMCEIVAPCLAGVRVSACAHSGQQSARCSPCLAGV